MDDLVGSAVGQVARLAPDHGPKGGRGVPDQALGEGNALGDHLDGVLGHEVALDADDPGREQRTPVVASGRGRAPASIRTRPDAPSANAIHSLRLGRRSLRARTAVPTGSPAIAWVMTSGRSAAAMTTRTPDHAAILAACSLLAIPPLPRLVPAPPATASSAASTSTISSISDASSSRRGSAVNNPAVSVQHEQQLRADEVRDECREAIVVAISDLVIGDGVVLVDHGDDTELEQPAERLAGVEVLRPVPEVVGCEQHLSGNEVVLTEDRTDARHEQRLADRRDRLERPDVVRARAEPERGQAGGDRTGADEHEVVPARARLGELAHRA